MSRTVHKLCISQRRPSIGYRAGHIYNYVLFLLSLVLYTIYINTVLFSYPTTVLSISQELEHKNLHRRCIFFSRCGGAKNPLLPS